MPYPAIKVRALQAFVAVYEEQSFSRAAERENMTQSGMSTQVKDLELTLGTQLLIRERRQFQLTPEGEIVYREGQSILKALMATENAVRDMKGSVGGMVRFGMIPSLTRSILISALKEFKAEYPDVDSSLVEEYSFSLMRRVTDGELDFALVPATDLPPGLTGRFIGQDREMLVSSASFDRGTTHMDQVPLSSLSGTKLIVPSGLNVRRKKIDMLLNTHGIHLSDLLEMDGMLATLEMVGATDWVAILPSAICHPDKDGSIRRLNPIKDPPLSLEYVLVEKTEAATPRAAKLLADCLTTHLTAILSDWSDLLDGGKAAIENAEA